MSIYDIEHTSNRYYSAFMDTRTIFCICQGQDKPTEAYYRRSEAVISTAELVKCVDTMHVKLKRTHKGGDNDDLTKRFQAMCVLNSD